VVNVPEAQYEEPRISPDGRYIAVQVNDVNDTHVRVFDVERETISRLTFGDNDRHPLWTPDGERIVFSSASDSPVRNLWVRAADGTGRAERLTTSDRVQAPSSWTPDGELVFNELIGRGDVGVLSLALPDQTEWLLDGEFQERYPEVSPDGRWIAYASLESGQSEVYVRSFPNVDDGKWQVSRMGGDTPLWGPSGDELYFRGLDIAGSLMVVDVQAEPTFRPSVPTVLFQAGKYYNAVAGRPRPFDIDSSGERFLLMTDPRVAESGEILSSRLTVVLNWDQELLERVPAP
jgi:Tol biopolymer transport system component